MSQDQIDVVPWESVIRALRLQAKRRASGVLVGSCVFHRERTPSLHLWPSGRFRCHGCGAAGTVRDFVSRFTVDVDEFFRRLPPPPDSRQLELVFPLNRPTVELSVQ